MLVKCNTSAIGFAMGLLALAPLASAAAYTFQDGLNSYDGTQDASLYAGDPNAGGPGRGVNTGGSPTIYTNGVHLGILSFDLSSLAGQTVTADATLTLTMADNHVGVPFSVYQISDANAGWSQGDNPAYAPADVGDVTYEDRIYNTSPNNSPWVGGAGLAGAGGYDHTAVASGVGGLYNTTVALTIPQSLIQHWIDGPNAGLLIMSDSPGTTVQFRSSDDTAGRPMLTITTNAVPEPAAFSVLGLMAGGLLLSRRRK